MWTLSRGRGGGVCPLRLLDPVSVGEGWGLRTVLHVRHHHERRANLCMQGRANGRYRGLQAQTEELGEDRQT